MNKIRGNLDTWNYIWDIDIINKYGWEYEKLSGMKPDAPYGRVKQIPFCPKTEMVKDGRDVMTLGECKKCEHFNGTKDVLNKYGNMDFCVECHYPDGYFKKIFRKVDRCLFKIAQYSMYGLEKVIIFIEEKILRRKYD